MLLLPPLLRTKGVLAARNSKLSLGVEVLTEGTKVGQHRGLPKRAKVQASLIVALWMTEVVDVLSLLPERNNTVT